MSEYGSLGEALIEAAREMVAIHRGELEPARVHYRVMTGPDTDLIGPPFYTPRKIREIREKMGVSQVRFAKVMNCKASTVKAWEEDVREPNAASRRLLQIAEQHPEMLLAISRWPDPEESETPAEEPKLRRAG
jgi:DNA-binding XRE family transcriptional regulator